MKPHPRIRKTIKWGGAAVTLLLVVVWIGSGGIAASWKCGPEHEVGIGGGVVGASYANYSVYDNAAPPEPPWTRIGSFELVWWFELDSHSPFYWQFGIPMWPMAAFSALIAVSAWRLGRV
jgi:hypothetical protein